MIYEYWYAGISGLNCMKKKKLREILKTAEMIYYIEEIKLTELGILTDREIQALIKAKKQQDIKEKWEMLEEKNIRFIPYFSEEYPVRLKNIPAPPYALYVRAGCRTVTDLRLLWWVQETVRIMAREWH